MANPSMLQASRIDNGDAGYRAGMDGKAWQFLSGPWKPKSIDLITIKMITMPELREIFPRMLAWELFGRILVRIGSTV